MIQRADDDRRIKKIKVKNNNRKKTRRKEDVDNVKAYYFMVSFMGCLLLTVGILSYILR